MKKLLRPKLACTLLCCIVFTVLVKAQKIGLLMANQYSERWIIEKSHMMEKLKELGAEVFVETAEDNMEKQLAQSQKLIAAGVKVLIVVAVDCKAAAKIVEEAHRSRTKVIAYDRLILNSSPDYYISFNSTIIGEMIASYIYKLKPNGNYVFLNGPVADFNSQLIREGVMRVLNEPVKNGSIKLILDKNLNEWSELETYMEMSAFFNTSTLKPDAIISGADAIGLGAANAIDEQKLSGQILIGGQDADLQACRRIVLGKYSVTILKKPKQLAIEAAMLAYKVARGGLITNQKLTFTDNGTTKVPSLLLEPVLIDKSTIDKEIIEAGHLSKTQIYGQ